MKYLLNNKNSWKLLNWIEWSNQLNNQSKLDLIERAFTMKVIEQKHELERTGVSNY